MKNVFIVAFCFLFTTTVVAQVLDTPLDSVSEMRILIEGDSISQSAIPLNEVYVFGPLKFANKKERLRYYILRRKTIKVFPYAKLAAERLTALNDSLTYIKKRRQRKRYTKKVQKYIEGEFSEELKKLTRTEGQILVKLIHRQTGTNAFDLVKELRSGWRAFWYSTTANMFDISIKKEYNPEMVEEDYLIEDILQRAFAAGRIESQASALNYDYTILSDKWHVQGDKQ